MAPGGSLLASLEFLPATPLLWKTVMKSELKGWRNEHEDALLERFREVLPEGVKVTVLADRAFGDQARYELLKDQLGLDFVVRFRGIVKVTSADGETKPAASWAQERAAAAPARREGHQGRPRTRRCRLREGQGHEGGLAPGHQPRRPHRRRGRGAQRQALHRRGELPRSEVRHGFGNPDRRDRMLLISAISLLTILGAAGEAIGHDKWLKTNTESLHRVCESRPTRSPRAAAAPARQA